jgi:broad specificity phosphatase PhoE
VSYLATTFQVHVILSTLRQEFQVSHPSFDVTQIFPMPTGRLVLLFIRHGETQDNIDRVLQGHRDTSLTEKGHREAKVLASKLQTQRIDVIYHSPLQRITQTISPILENQPDISTHADADLKGQYLGELEGSSYDIIDMSNPRSADERPGVEVFDAFVRRLKRSFGRIVGVEAPLVGMEDRAVAVATHGVGITSLFKTLESSPGCDGFNSKLAVRGPDAYEVRWTDSDDVSRLIVEEPAELPVEGGALEWEKLVGQPFLIEVWGKKEKALS